MSGKQEQSLKCVYMVISMFLKIKMPETSVKDEFVSSFEIFSSINLHASCKMCGDKSCSFQRGNNTQLLLN